jgi:hypothetical protein
LPWHTAHAATHAAAAKHLTEEVFDAATAHAATHATEIHRRATSTTASAAEHVAHLFLLVVFSSSLGGSNGVVSGLHFLEFSL